LMSEQYWRQFCRSFLIPTCVRICGRKESSARVSLIGKRPRGRRWVCMKRFMPELRVC